MAELNQVTGVSGRLRRAAMMIVLALAVAPGAQAQGSRPQAARVGTISGTVVDTNGVAIPEVTVTLVKSQRRTITNAEGAFRFDSIPYGVHEVSARGIGLLAGVHRVTVGPNVASVTIVMIRFSTSLPSMITTATQGGLSGVIGDTAFKALAGVVVTAVGGSQIAKTDSMGAFSMPLNPGRYVIRLDREGYERQTMGVTIPEAEGRKIAAWLAPRTGAPNHMEAQELFDLGQRMIHVSHVSAKFYSREDLVKQGVIDLQSLAIRWQTGQITNECKVFVNGTRLLVPIWELTTAEVEFVEVYLPTKIGSTRQIQSLSGRQTTIPTTTFVRPPASSACGNVGLVAWLRK